MVDVNDTADDIIATVTSGVQKARARRAELVKSASDFTSKTNAEIQKLDRALASLGGVDGKPRPAAPKSPPVPPKVPTAPGPREPAKQAPAKGGPKAPKASAAAKEPGAPKGKPGRKPSPSSRTGQAISFILKNKDASTAEIASHLGIDNVQASQVVNQLKAQGRLSSKGSRGAFRHYATNGAGASA